MIPSFLLKVSNIFPHERNGGLNVRAIVIEDGCVLKGGERIAKQLHVLGVSRRLQRFRASVQGNGIDGVLYLLYFSM